MYAELIMNLKEEDLNYRKMSKLHGVIMENIDEEYAGLLHSNRLNPFSQCLLKENQTTFWYVRTTVEEAYKRLLTPLRKLDRFQFDNCSEIIQISERTVNTYSEEELLDEFYCSPGKRYLNVEFQTPTAFKQKGRYVNYPDLELLYGSLMRKYSASSTDLDMVDENTLEQLVMGSEIVRYRLRTVAFPLEKINITGFCGRICIHFKGTDTMARYARLLMRFGRFSGVGIKAGMGMGAIRLIERK